MPSRTHNPEKRAWRGKSHKKGGERVRALREAPEKPVKRVGPKLSAVPVTPSTDMTTTELVRTLRDRGVQGDIEGFVETADEDEIRELLHDLRVWANPPKVMFWDFNTGRHTYSEAEAKAWREDGETFVNTCSRRVEFEMKRVIIADDDSLVLRSVARVLKPLSLDIATASDGSVALAMAIENPPALLITDGEMRTMHGPELIRELRKVPATASVPIILCSGNTGLAEVATSLGVPFFSKGRGMPKDLIALVQQALG